MSNAWKVDMVIFSPRGHFYSSESENKVYLFGHHYENS